MNGARATVLGIAATVAVTATAWGAAASPDARPILVEGSQGVGNTAHVRVYSVLSDGSGVGLQAVVRADECDAVRRNPLFVDQPPEQAKERGAPDVLRAVEHDEERPPLLPVQPPDGVEAYRHVHGGLSCPLRAEAYRSVQGHPSR